MENVFSIHQQSTRVIVSMETAQMAFTKVGFPKFCQTSTNLWNHHLKLFSENQRRTYLTCLEKNAERHSMTLSTEIDADTPSIQTLYKLLDLST